MRLPIAAVAFAAAIALVAPAIAAAQEPVKSFDQLNTRLKPGDRIWVTDAKGREIAGRIQSLSPGALTLSADGSRTFAAADVRQVRAYTRDSLLRGGTLIGMGIGGGLAAAWCIGAAVDDSPEINAGVECAEGFIVFGGLGTLIGLAIDAGTGGKGLVVYRAPGASGHARLLIAPMVTRRTKGLALSFAF